MYIYIYILYIHTDTTCIYWGTRSCRRDAHLQSYIHIYLHIYIYIYIYIYIRVRGVEEGRAASVHESKVRLKIFAVCLDAMVNSFRYVLGFLCMYVHAVHMHSWIHIYATYVHIYR